jgi:hypothetical protein
LAKRGKYGILHPISMSTLVQTDKPKSSQETYQAYTVERQKLLEYAKTDRSMGSKGVLEQDLDAKKELSAQLTMVREKLAELSDMLPFLPLQERSLAIRSVVTNSSDSSEFINNLLQLQEAIYILNPLLRQFGQKPFQITSEDAAAIKQTQADIKQGKIVDDLFLSPLGSIEKDIMKDFIEAYERLEGVKRQLLWKIDQQKNDYSTHLQEAQALGKTVKDLRGSVREMNRDKVTPPVSLLEAALLNENYAEVSDQGGIFFIQDLQGTGLEVTLGRGKSNVLALSKDVLSVSSTMGTLTFEQTGEVSFTSNNYGDEKKPPVYIRRAGNDTSFAFDSKTVTLGDGDTLICRQTEITYDSKSGQLAVKVDKARYDRALANSKAQ